MILTPKQWSSKKRSNPACLAAHRDSNEEIDIHLQITKILLARFSSSVPTTKI